MGRLRKRFNEKARQSTKNEVVLDQKEKIDIQLDVQEDKYDSTNPLVIVGKKKKVSKIKQQNACVAKPLSKKQKKKLANILSKKKKKLNREELLEKLSKVQAKPKELEFLTSTASMQTCGIKKFSEHKVITADGECSKISNNKGSKRKKDLPPKKKIRLDPNVVGFENSSESGEDFSDDEIVENKSNEDDENESTVQDITPASTLDTGDHKDEDKSNSTHNKGKSVTEGTSDSEFNAHEQKKKCDNSTISKVNKIVEVLGIPCDGNKNVAERVPAIYRTLNRLPDIQAAREALPIFCEEPSIMEAVKENDVVVIHGETGSGKTTQVPQFLYEGGYSENNKLIGITEPRRIAAMTMAARVATEMNLLDVVAYHVRYENSVKDETLIKFMTDGVLLKEIRRDFLLTRYSVIIIDEAHERSVFSDVLIGLLSRIVPIRRKRGDPLKLIIMSATMRVEDFVENPRLFKDSPPILRIDSRQYKVQVHFNIHTPTDYVEASYNKVCKIHTQLPPGAILVFLTGEKEVNALCKLLRNTYPFKDKSNYKSEDLKMKKSTENEQNSKKLNKRKRKESDSFCAVPLKINLDDYSAEPLDTETIQHQLSDEEDETFTNHINAKAQENFMPLYALPLYSILPFAEQEKVFQPPPPGSRLCVISTNVAETSITIPGLKYVVDSGKVKTKVYDKRSGGISQFCITWTSKASVNQRAGRAGRTEGGHCYRLYSSSVFEHEFSDFSLPEIQRIPVDDVLLQMKALGIDRVVNFPFPSPPENEALKSAEQRLVLIGALQDLNKGERFKDIKKWEYSAKITPLGKAMSRFPLSPRYSKMLILSYKHQVVPYMIAIVSFMTVPEVFLNSNNDDQNPPQKGLKKLSGKALELGDCMISLRTVALFEESKNKIQFCVKNGIRHKAMTEIHKMCSQLIREMNRAFQDLSLPSQLNFEPPNEEQLEKLRKILTTGFTDHVARLYPEEEMKLNKDIKNAYKCINLEEPVFIHPSSVLFSDLPRYIIYQEIVHTTKYYMKGIVEINPEWLPGFAPSLCSFSDPLDEPNPTYNREKDQILCMMNVTFGPLQWELPPATLEMPRGLLKYSWFACFLLEGQVFKLFKIYRKDLLSSPTTILKSWAKLLPRTRYLLQALIGSEVDSRESLENVWKKEPKYLLREYWEWLPSDKHMEIECKWPPNV